MDVTEVAAITFWAASVWRKKKTNQPFMHSMRHIFLDAAN
jgi:hypothetical protein